MIIKCAIVDDDKNDLERIRSAFEKLSFGTDIDFINDYYTDPNNPAILNSYSIHILDIDMPGIRGFDLAHQLSRKNPHAVICFCTNHDDLVYEALELNTFFFIRKDHLTEDLYKALQKYLAPNSSVNKLLIHIDNRSLVLNGDDIMFISVAGNNSTIRLTDGTTLTVRKSLKSIAEEICSETVVPAGKSYIINLSCISAFEKNTIVMRDASRIAVSSGILRNTKNLFMKHMMR